VWPALRNQTIQLYHDAMLSWGSAMWLHRGFMVVLAATGTALVALALRKPGEGQRQPGLVVRSVPSCDHSGW